MSAILNRLDPNARRCVLLAERTAREMGHNAVTSGHLLLAIVRLAEALGVVGLTEQRVRDMLVKMWGAPQPELPDDVPFTPRLKRAMELALRDALQLGRNYITPQDLLIALALEDEGIAGRVFQDCGLVP